MRYNKTKRFKTLIAIIFTVVLAMGLIGCGNQSSNESNTTDQTAVQDVNLTVSAAASLTDAMKEIQTVYAQEKPNVTITYNFASSGSLQQQIEQGAEVDVFLSAATKQMDAIQEKGLILDDTRKNFLENGIVLVVPIDSTLVADFNDLTKADVEQIAMGEPKSVPAGKYAEEALTNMKLMDAIKSKVVYGKDVREVLTWVETGNADAGMVYSTDAKISDKVKVVATAPEDSHAPVLYPAAVIKASKNVEAATDFVNFLYSDKAQPVFEKYGFIFKAE